MTPVHAFYEERFGRTGRLLADGVLFGIGMILIMQWWIAISFLVRAVARLVGEGGGAQ